MTDRRAVLLTGANGFIGRNLALHLATEGTWNVVPHGRASTAGDLASAVETASVICHLAGVNRPAHDDDFSRDNVEFTSRLCDAAEETGRAIPIVFASSIHAERDTPYGQSKRAAEDVLRRYAERSGAPVYIFRLPNVFGKWARPNYNSAVATFCHNIAHGLPIDVHDYAAPLHLVYIDDVVRAFRDVMNAPGDTSLPYTTVAPTYVTTVGAVADAIRAFRSSRETLVIDRVGEGLLRALYATYLSYLDPAQFSYAVPEFRDERGAFAELLKTRDSGQLSMFTAKPGVTRGGHYHHTKSEKFIVVRGIARFRFRHLLNDARHELTVSAEDSRIVEAVPGWAHDITNIGSDELVVVLWANEVFERDRPDTYPSSPSQ